MFTLRFRSDVRIAPTDERRREERKSIDAAGYIYLMDHVLTVRIADLSSTGACLSVSPNRVIPSSFDLRIPDHGTIRKARLIWRSGDRCGVEFQR